MSGKWTSVLGMINESSKRVTVRSVDENIKSKMRENYNIAEESVLGAVMLNTGGIVIDNWIRLYGAGEVDFFSRNREFPFDDIIIAEDIIGGLFAHLTNGKIAYFAPDTLEWEELNITYSQFLYWCLHGDTDTFYQLQRWNDWEKEVKDMEVDYGIAFYPYLWAQSESMESRCRRKIPMSEIIKLEHDFAKQFESKD